MAEAYRGYIEQEHGLDDIKRGEKSMAGQVVFQNFNRKSRSSPCHSLVGAVLPRERDRPVIAAMETDRVYIRLLWMWDWNQSRESDNKVMS